MRVPEKRSGNYKKRNAQLQAWEDKGWDTGQPMETAALYSVQ